MLTPNEIKLYKLALYWYKRYDDSNPDVGMPPFPKMLLDDLIRQTGIVPTTQEKQQILR